MNIIQKSVIPSGNYCDWKILIDDDRNGSTGGYYIYLENDNDQGFDYWCKDESELNNQLKCLNYNYSQQI